MKTIILLLFFCSSFAQNHENFTHCIFKSPDETVFRNTEINCRVFYDYGGEKGKIKMYFNSVVKLFTADNSITSEQEDFTVFYVMDEESKEHLAIQKFKDNKIGIRLIFLDGSSMQLINENNYK